MILNPADQYHLGMVVEDFDGARQSFTDTMGYEWGPDLHVEVTLSTRDTTMTFPHRLQFSITEPRLELIQAREGTPYQPSTSGLHHYGYWCDDVRQATQALEAQGWAWECGGEMDGTAIWAYHLNPKGIRIEIVSRAIAATSSFMWTPSS